ncbi:hypothetical protein CC79DRAFT_907103 [Sarocladium strictum]
MTIKRKLFASAAVAIALGTGYVGSRTTLRSPLPATDPIFASKAFRKLNSFGNPTNSDECWTTIPLSRLRPELLENEADLALEFCRGIWSSRIGFDLPRLYWYLRWYTPSTSAHLWTRHSLSSSSYTPGTHLTNHFTVLSKTSNSITIRFGDSPSNSGPRPLDGIFEIKAQIHRDEGVARLSLKTLVFCGDRRMDGKIVPLPADLVHHSVARLWCVTGSWGLYT